MHKPHTLSDADETALQEHLAIATHHSREELARFSSEELETINRLSGQLGVDPRALLQHVISASQSPEVQMATSVGQIADKLQVLVEAHASAERLQLEREAKEYDKLITGKPKSPRSDRKRKLQKASRKKNRR